MGKKKERQLGSTLINDHRKSHKRRDPKKDSWLHTTEMDDSPYPGYDPKLDKLKSCTEQSALMEFLSTAELAGQDFTAERDGSMKVIDPKSTGILSGAHLDKRKKAQEEKKHFLRVPRRPAWDETTTAEQLELNERTAFVEWRRGLAAIQEDEDIICTPFEKNLELWRQLWRVIERSDVLVQIVDARNPMLFFCPDLEVYVKEVDPNKICVILMNKSDLLTAEQRHHWARYFTSKGLRVLFWSAKAETEKIEAGIEDDDGEEKEEEEETDDEGSDNWETEDEEVETSEATFAAPQKPDDEPDRPSFPPVDGSLVSADQLLLAVKRAYKGDTCMDGVTTIGLVGYPNVGKSSTINAILRSKKVAVSATPGKTKHFQTIYVDPSLLLCDCPGLVFPSFVTSKEELVLNGILPVDQLRDYVSPVNLLCSRIPRRELEQTYGLLIPRPPEGQLQSRPPNAEEFLSSHGLMRGYMTSQGRPDCSRSARVVLKDHVNGKLLFCHPPPDLDPTVFYGRLSGEEEEVVESGKEMVSLNDNIMSSKRSRGAMLTSEKIDAEFFSGSRQGFGSRGKKGVFSNSAGQSVSVGQSSQDDKPWKKHNNRNKKEKLRRVFGYMDQV